MSKTDWHTTPPTVRSGIFDVTILVDRIPSKPFRMTQTGYWMHRKWSVPGTAMFEGLRVIAWAERREHYAGPIETTMPIVPHVE